MKRLEQYNFEDYKEKGSLDLTANGFGSLLARGGEFADLITYFFPRTENIIPLKEERLYREDAVIVPLTEFRNVFVYKAQKHENSGSDQFSISIAPGTEGRRYLKISCPFSIFRKAAGLKNEDGFTQLKNEMKAPEFEKESKIYVGEDNVIYAYASDRRVAGDPQWGDLAYVPARYEVYKGGVKESEGTFTLENNATGQYKATFKPAVKASDYSIKVLYAKERWEGVGVQYITVDTDTVRTLKFEAKNKPPKWVGYITTAITFFLSTIPKLIQKILPAFKFLMDNIRKNA